MRKTKKSIYEITVEFYNHVSGYGSYTYETRYTDKETAKRKLVELALNDDNLFEEDATCEISKDLESARTTGRHDDYCEYYISEVEELDICDEKAPRLSRNELEALIEERMNGEDTLKIKVA